MVHKDFVLELDTHFIRGKVAADQLRIVFRDVYHFYLDNSGNMTLWYEMGYTSNNRNYPISSKARGNYEANHILIIARGNRYAFYVNDIPVYYLEDAYYFTRKDITFRIANDRGNTTVALDNLKLWDLGRIPNLP